MKKVFTETQKIAAGSDFDGAMPDVAFGIKSNDLLYLEGTSGGLFKMPIAIDESGNRVEAITGQHARTVKSLRIHFGGQTSWYLSMVNIDGDETIWLDGNLEESVVAIDPFELEPGSNLKLVTVGASTAMYASVNYEVSRRGE